MTVEALKQVEAAPSSYPDVPAGLSTAAAALDADALWQRIEGYVAHRWAARTVVWTVLGPGEWTPPLVPATVTTAQRWTGSAWEDATLATGPLDGLELPGEGPYRITATVGAGPVPAPALESYRRLAEYLAEGAAKAGASSYSYRLGEVEESWQRNPAWTAKALQQSGAADLLRPYRRA
jgi:hypothetical protein